ncbi:hypothetical protein [Flavobacterium panacagri]|uniref:hypothetical protein n=1 Tax=Flavobacterium panacagri TaxID=3034146 RepID=UPI0025A530DA|nr:hypothetical protein [Flavobacterium panacagri]
MSLFLFTVLNRNIDKQIEANITAKNLGGFTEVFVKYPLYETTPTISIHRGITSKTLLFLPVP